MNQFHTPSFGDEVFELNDTPAESPSQAVSTSAPASAGGSQQIPSDPFWSFGTQRAITHCRAGMGSNSLHSRPPTLIAAHRWS